MSVLWASLWLASPVILAGLVHILLIKADVWPALGRLPLDGGLTLRGHRILGDNKTVRGVVLMIPLTMICAVAQSWLSVRMAWIPTLALPPATGISPVIWGLLLGAGYVVGELPNSFIKRQLEIAPGGAGCGWSAPVFWVVDQIDSLIGTVLAMSIVWVPPLDIVIALTVITLALHPLAALCMVALGLKQRVG